MDWPPIAEEWARDLVAFAHDEVLQDELQSWRDPGNQRGRMFITANLSDEQRRLVWALVAGAVENAYHHFIAFIDEKVVRGDLELRLIDKQSPEQSLNWRQAQVGEAYGFSADILERYGADPMKVYDRSREWPKPSPHRVADARADVERLANRVAEPLAADERCVECGRPPDALRRRCPKCGQAY